MRPARAHSFGSNFDRLWGRLWLGAFGWQIVTDWPGINKMVFVAAPHTSNWDGLHMIAAAAVYRVKLRWMGKAALGRGILGFFTNRAGLVPVDRSGANDMVSQVAAQFAKADDMVLAIAPEGTRQRNENWKLGFYHIAKAANVPIMMAVLDYGTRTIKLVGPVHPGDDMDADIAEVKAAYAGAQGKHPEKFAPVS